MKVNSAAMILLPLGCILAASLCGCCATVGWAVGAALHGAIPERKILPAGSASDLVPGAAVDILYTDGRTLAGFFDGLVSEPDRAAEARALAVVTGSGRTLVPLDSILQIQTPFRSHARSTGFMIGLSVDALIVAGWIASRDAHDKGYNKGYDDGEAAWRRDHP